ncbi:MAG: tRNA (adenosine(37)-N6)-threonylcarbamoyltransferase complex ATPase subunit type 1 TsaE [Synergistaceae bacterium]|nr:tRNA (adenosine(37)-N6)-threonylcarbamoyltransferase complex ATPase subunit type 1 TsaE [Synergistaceae bacterium]
MSERLFVSRSESETRELGRKLGENIEAGLCVLLYGDLGAGKTVLVRGGLRRTTRPVRR